jgi:hypothetical protein
MCISSIGACQKLFLLGHSALVFLFCFIQLILYWYSNLTLRFLGIAAILMPRLAGLQSLVNQYHSVSTLLLTLVSITGAPTNSLNYPDLVFNIHNMVDDSLKYCVLLCLIFLKEIQ